jgi:lysophospholipase L1-like esterase
MVKEKSSRITLAELRQLAIDGKLSAKALQRYFEIDQKARKSLGPVLRINKKTVDLGADRISPREVAQLLNRAINMAAGAKPPAVEDALTLAPTSAAPSAGGPVSMKKFKATAAKVRIYPEGDSWFNLPDFPVPSLFPPGIKIYPPDCVDVLDKTFEAKANFTAIWGDELGNMVKEKQYLQKLKGGNFRHFLVSGGGNDILQDIESNILSRKAGDTNPATVAKYVAPGFDDRIKKLIKLYKTIRDEVTAKVNVEVIMYVHGYANAPPIPGGEYLGVPLKGRNFDPVKVPAMAQAMVAELVRRFNVALAAFAASHSRVVYVDMRPFLTDPADWNWDEIHPSEQGAKKVAAQFKTAINQHSFLS